MALIDAFCCCLLLFSSGLLQSEVVEWICLLDSSSTFAFLRLNILECADLNSFMSISIWVSVLSDSEVDISNWTRLNWKVKKERELVLEESRIGQFLSFRWTVGSLILNLCYVRLLYLFLGICYSNENWVSPSLPATFTASWGGTLLQG